MQEIGRRTTVIKLKKVKAG